MNASLFSTIWLMNSSLDLQAFWHSAYVHLIFWHHIYIFWHPIYIFWHPICMFTRWHLYWMPEYIFWHSISEDTFWHPHILASYIVSVYEMTSIWDARIHILAFYIRIHILASSYSGILYRKRVHLYTYTQVKSSVYLFYVSTTRDNVLSVNRLFYVSR